jgi:hypothetical protein
MQPTPVEFLSEEYFNLVANNPELAGAFALGEQVIALSNGQVYEVVAGSVAQQTIATVTTTPAASPQPAVTPSLPTHPATVPTQIPTETSPATATGLCGFGLLPLFILPLMVVGARIRKKIGAH